MYQEEYDRMVSAASAKLALHRQNPTGYFIGSMLAGMYVGFGILLIFSIGGPLSASQSPVVKLVMGLSFGIALSLVIMAGSELFTGNVMTMGAALLRKTATFRDTLQLLLACWAGNLAGSALLGWMYAMTGLATGSTADLIAKTSAVKMTLSFPQLFFRAVLCNVLVCLAVWCGYRLKEEIARLVMIFWCLFAFISSGYEHSIANMTLLTVGLLLPDHPELTLAGYVWNLLVATAGNIVGAIVFLALPYHLMSKEKAHA